MEQNEEIYLYLVEVKEKIFSITFEDEKTETLLHNAHLAVSQLANHFKPEEKDNATNP
jgi:hypothetical protein